jgi:selenocysteine lyase/cysteine desulfurase
VAAHPDRARRRSGWGGGHVRRCPERSGRPACGLAMLTDTAYQAPPDEEFAQFLARYPAYTSTSALDTLRATEYAYLDRNDEVYLDYTGGGVAARSQLAVHTARLAGSGFGNPHSENPASVASAQLIAAARRAVLAHLNAAPEEYAVIFTPNATGACRLIGEAYPFTSEQRFVAVLDNHNSVNGIREFARTRGAATQYLPLTRPELRVDHATVVGALAGSGPRRPGEPARGLFAYPAQSNFTGVQHPLDWVDMAHAHGFDVLLDAAAYLPTNQLDLRTVRPEFVVASWYKVFGYPTGVGCLVARWEALARLRRPWFAGGTVMAVSAQGEWHQLLGDESAFEDGTLNYLSIPDVEVGLSWIASIGIDVIHLRVHCLTGWLLDRLANLRHSNGAPMAIVYGPADTHARGGTVAFNLLDPAGALVDERRVAGEAAGARFAVRTGCFCNPGAGEAAFDITRRVLRRPLQGAPRTVDEYLALLGLSTGGAVRVSLGVASTFTDVQRFLQFCELTYRDRSAHTAGLGSRTRC